MSEHTLPEDVRRWPDDPYELLGVQFGVLPRDLKRAYTRLIRTYKPEQSPDEFRLIREAYEAVLRHIEWFGNRQPVPVETSDEDARPAESSESQESTDSPQTTLPPLAQGPAIEQELLELWERATTGEEWSVYPQLVRLHDTHPGHVDVCLRLYWLLSIAPHLDSQRSPLDWLAAGLKQSNLAGPLRELYRREILAEPGEALSHRFTELLNRHASPGIVADLLQWRWQAARKLLRGFDVVVQDLELFRLQRVAGSGISSDIEESWVRLLFLAADYLAWSPESEHREALQGVLKEIHALDHLHTRMTGSLDRLDLLLELSTSWQRLTDDRSARPAVLAALLNLTPSMWNGDLQDLRPELLDCFEQIARSPAHALQSLDLLRQKCSTALSLFGQFVTSFEQSIEPPADPRPQQQVADLVERFLDVINWRYYSANRGEFLSFMLKEAVSPQQFVESIQLRADLWVNQDSTLARTIEEDWPLRYIYRACQAYWA